MVPSPVPTFVDRVRGQSSLIGLILVFGMVLAGTVTVVVLGAGAIEDQQEPLSTEQAEKELTEFDSRVSLVAVGDSEVQSVQFSMSTASEYTVKSNTGWMNVTAENASGSTNTLMNVSMGKMVYEDGETTIGYQGGGVWRASEGGGVMVSPPELHYQDGTLTLTAVTLNGSGSVGSNADIQSGSSTKVYPSSGGLDNPLTDRKINITIKSEFYRAWGEYFENRINSEVTYIDSENKVRARLVPPPEPIMIDAALRGTNDLDIDGTAAITGDVSLGGETNDEGYVTGDVEENVAENEQLETATSKISSAESRLTGEPAPSDTSEIEAGTYFVSDDSVFDDQTTLNTTDGDIELFVDGDVSTSGIGGPFSDPEVNVTGDGDVDIYVNGEFDMQGQAIWGHSSKVDSFTVYSEEVDRITEFHGVLYTGAVDIAGGGATATLFGAVISTTNQVDMTGNVQIQYDDDLNETKVQEVNPEFASISYLHLTKSETVVE